MAAVKRGKELADGACLVEVGEGLVPERGVARNKSVALTNSVTANNTGMSATPMDERAFRL
jgi:hypothetical protein